MSCGLDKIKQDALELMQLDKALKMLLKMCYERADNDDDRAEIAESIAECEARLNEYQELMS